MTTIAEGRHAAEFLISEAQGTRSREVVTLATGNDLEAGAVLGRIPAGTAGVPVKTGTGNGTMTMDVTTPVLFNGKTGTYTATCVAAASNSGTFRVEDPDGLVLGDVVVGATFADGIKFVIADGATDFIVGDKFTVAVVVAQGEYTELDPTATDGSQIASAVLFAAVDATAADRAAVVIKRDAEVAAHALGWNEAVTTDQKTAAIAQLNTLGIVVR
jgi:hypothetical protein